MRASALAHVPHEQEVSLASMHRLVMAGAACALAVSAGAAGGVTASASALASPWSSQVVRPAQASCPRGETLIAPTGAKTDALGVTHVTYSARPGMVASIPPQGMTASQVTPAVMADLGMRVTHPASAKARHLRQQVMKLAKNRTAPEFCYSKPDPARVWYRGSKNPVLGHVYSGNWSGYAVTEAEHGGAINGVTGSWAVPQSMTSSAPSAEATWVGIGGGLGEGSSTNGLIQAGTEMQTGDGYRTVWEYIGTAGCVAPTFCGQYSGVNAVRPGTQINADVWWDTSTTATFLVSTSSGGDFDIRNHSTGGIPYDHTSAEWINEWPGNGYYDSPGTVHFAGQGLTGAFGGQGSFTSPFTGSFEAVIMWLAVTSGTSCSDGKVLSYPANAANGSGGGTSDIITCTRNGIDSP